MTGRSKSAVPGFAWPAIATGPAATMLALLYQLEGSQWLPAEEILARQFEQLSVLLAHAVQQVPHYRALGLDPSVRTPAQLRAWPTLKKAEVLELDAQLRAPSWPKQHGRPIVSATTGSTGQPVRLQFTEAAALITHALVVRSHLWHRFDFSQKYATINPHIKDRSWPDWGRPAASVFATGPSASLDISAGVDRQLDWLIAEAPRYLQTRPSNLRALLLHSRETGRVPPGLDTVLLQSEILHDGLRELARELWNVRLVDTYSCGELGTLALQCPADENAYHVQAESAYIEVLDDAGNPCAPGQTGRVVATSLHNFAMPLVRYELGDFAETGAACACGRGLSVLRRIAGRARNMATDPTGRVFWPSFHAPLWLEIAALRQIRLVQHTAARIEVQYVLDRDLSAGEQSGLRRNLHVSLRYPFEIEFTRLAEIPRAPGAKYEDFVSLIDAQALVR